MIPAYSLDGAMVVTILAQKWMWFSNQFEESLEDDRCDVMCFLFLIDEESAGLKPSFD